MKSNEINELAAALCKAQQEIKGAHKDSSNPFYKSKYADLTSTWEACRHALNKNGLSVVQTIRSGAETRSLENPSWIKRGEALVTTLIHTSGQWIEGDCPLLNSKGDMQGLGSAISYARRYGLAAICGVVADDDDANTADQPEHREPVRKEPMRADLGEPCTLKQAKLIKAKLIANGLRGAEASNILLAHGSEYPEKIPFVKVNDVLKAIEVYAKTHGLRDPSEPPDQDEPPFNPDVGWR